MPTAAGARTLSLYRQILRIGRSWAGPREEQKYIYSEARKQFRAHQHTTQPAELDKQILEGELRLQYAQQYQIPYPRLEHKTQYKRSHPAPRGDFGRQPSTAGNAASGKLAEAMQRRRQVGCLACNTDTEGPLFVPCNSQHAFPWQAQQDKPG